MEWIAHIDEHGRVQSVKEHSEATAELCEANSVHELKDICRFIGLLHDIGKYAPEFQRHIRGENNRFEHSLCGAKR